MISAPNNKKWEAKRWNAIDEPFFLFWQINKKINPKGVLLKWIMNTPNKFSYVFPASTKWEEREQKKWKLIKVENTCFLLVLWKYILSYLFCNLRWKQSLNFIAFCIFCCFCFWTFYIYIEAHFLWQQSLTPSSNSPP